MGGRAWAAAGGCAAAVGGVSLPGGGSRAGVWEGRIGLGDDGRRGAGAAALEGSACGGACRARLSRRFDEAWLLYLLVLVLVLALVLVLVLVLLLLLVLLLAETGRVDGPPDTLMLLR